jgi:hypothetical protein
MAVSNPSPRPPHPAGRARKVVATASVAALCGLGGFMAATSTAAGGATATDHGSTATDDGAQSADQHRYDGGWGAPVDPWGSGDPWGAQGAPGGSASSSSSSPAPHASSHAS